MKSSFAVLLSVIAVIHGAAIENVADTAISGKSAAPLSLFESAWEYQTKFASLQQDIDEKLTAIRTAVSGVLKSSSNLTLEQIESNAKQITTIAEPARNAVFDTDLSATLCVVNLRNILQDIAQFTGFGSSNCVTSYDKSLTGVLNKAYAFLQKYEGFFGDVQQVVVKAFIGKNAFLEPEAIQSKFEVEYETRVSAWNEIRPEVENFKKDLYDNVAVFNSVLGGCFHKIQIDVAPAFTVVQSQLATCNIFDNTADPFAIYRQ